MAKTKLFFAGSGGQGILMMGQLIAYSAMYQGKEVTYMPSYGPEMRGGTANCTVILADAPISSPLITETDVLVVMNLPSLLKFESMVAPGGTMFVNTSLVAEKAKRDDINVVYVDTAALAESVGNKRGANMAMLGAIVHKTGVATDEEILKLIHKTFDKKGEAITEANIKAYYAWKE